MNANSRRSWASKLARELERPNTLIDYGYIVIWLDNAGWYNHASSFEPYRRGSGNTTIAISRFRQFKLEPTSNDMPGYPPRCGNPLVVIACTESEAMDLTEWVVHWSRSNENGTEPLFDAFGVYNLTSLPTINAMSKSHWDAYCRDLKETERWYGRVMVQGGK